VDLGVDHLELGLGVAGTLEHFLARVVGRGLAGVCQSSGAESLHLQVPQPAGPNRLTQRERQGGWKRETHIHARAERERERERERLTQYQTPCERRDRLRGHPAETGLRRLSEP
jgi:hypothetical protein